MEATCATWLSSVGVSAYCARTYFQRHTLGISAQEEFFFSRSSAAAERLSCTASARHFADKASARSAKSGAGSFVAAYEQTLALASCGSQPKRACRRSQGGKSNAAAKPRVSVVQPRGLSCDAAFGVNDVVGSGVGGVVGGGLSAVGCRAIKIDRSAEKKPTADEIDEKDDELCPVTCVKEVHSLEELNHFIDMTRGTPVLVVVDFYRTACGSCKYIEHGFQQLCRGEGDAQHPVIFLKHNVYDEYEEPSDISDKFRIKAVPMFHFYHNGELVDHFATRDKTRVRETIGKYVDLSDSPE